MRLIDADALIPMQVHTVVVLKDGREQLESVLYAEQVDDAPTVEPASPWHRVEDELPEIGQIVLVYDECRRLSICQLDNSYRWLLQGGGWFNGPCACYWMPIEPPKEDA